mgnify:CR=1 FL=1
MKIYIYTQIRLGILLINDCHIENPNEPCGNDDFWDRLAEKIED